AEPFQRLIIIPEFVSSGAGVELDLVPCVSVGMLSQGLFELLVGLGVVIVPVGIKARRGGDTSPRQDQQDCGGGKACRNRSCYGSPGLSLPFAEQKRRDK